MAQVALEQQQLIHQTKMLIVVGLQALPKYGATSFSL